ncbi:unnamed protein product [Colias eurytheme]|nr:unnamed protein product [Colias eurytheme]
MPRCYLIQKWWETDSTPSSPSEASIAPSRSPTVEPLVSAKASIAMDVVKKEHIKIQTVKWLPSVFSNLFVYERSSVCGVQRRRAAGASGVRRSVHWLIAGSLRRRSPQVALKLAAGKVCAAWCERHPPPMPIEGAARAPPYPQYIPRVARPTLTTQEERVRTPTTPLARGAALSLLSFSLFVCFSLMQSR